MIFKETGDDDKLDYDLLRPYSLVAMIAKGDIKIQTIKKDKYGTKSTL